MNTATARIVTGMTVLLLAALAMLAISAPKADAIGMDGYRTVLEKNGYKVTAGSTVTHATLSVSGTILIVESSGRTAQVEFLDYGTNAKLKEDWNAVNGEGPTPKKATKDFDGKILYWNNDSILVVDYNSPNDSLVARGAANSFLGKSGTGGQQPGTVTPAPGSPTPAPASPTATPGNLPPTGGPPAADEGTSTAAALALLMAAAVAILAGGVMVRKSLRY